MISKKNLFRIKFSLAVVVVAAVALVGYGFYKSEEKIILQTLHQDTAVLSDTIKQGFKHYMMDNRREKTQDLVDKISMLTSIEKVRVYDRSGWIRFSSHPGEVGQKGNLSDPTCRLCHGAELIRSSLTVTFVSESGQKVFRNVNPIENEPACYSCHSQDEKLLGILMLDFSMSGARRVFEHFRWATMFLVLSIVIVFGIFIFLDQVYSYLQS